MIRPTWRSSLQLGLEVIDSQHEKQLALLDELEEAVLSQASRTTVDHLLLELLACTTDHFATEHELMWSSQCPEREEHMEDHDGFLQQLSRLLTSHLQRDRELTLEVVQALRPCAVDHIQTRDRALAAYLRGRAEAPA